MSPANRTDSTFQSLSQLAIRFGLLEGHRAATSLRDSFEPPLAPATSVAKEVGPSAFLPRGEAGPYNPGLMLIITSHVNTMSGDFVANDARNSALSGEPTATVLKADNRDDRRSLSSNAPPKNPLCAPATLFLTRRNDAMTRLYIERDGTRATVWLDRPEIHNAFDPEMIDELDSAFRNLGADESVRVIVLAGAGRSFSAGADLEWMRSIADQGMAENVADAKRLADMLSAIPRLRQTGGCSRAWRRDGRWLGFGRRK